ncbi:MAG: TolC family protein [Blastocatellia bacterium]|nr:TolC family protein [Blastocatellia bacterium]MCS7156756.1 TolC family protein [Blastocatellia bacterium]MCX7751502.1 TolC family protein [Blastocatellia bacterium]MDW8168602.1 TolC family protein [Acidobacteriota bacterium]MDW8256567.1 TolC family protein [Acidobacteriota bacterium]
MKRIGIFVLISLAGFALGSGGRASLFLAHAQELTEPPRISPMETPRVPTALTLAAAIEYARRWHPRLQAAREQVRMAHSEAVTARLRPNPTFTFSGENFTPSSLEAEWFAFLSQTIEIGQKRERRMEVAEWTIRIAEAAAQQVERHVLAEVKFAYERALLQRARWELARENLETFRQIVRYNEVRVAEGYTAEGDLIKVRLEAQRAEFAMRQAQLEYEQAKIALLRAMGATSFDQTFELREELTFEPVHVRIEELERAALERPEAVRARAELERAHASWQLERARAKPDLVASFGYKRHGPNNTLYGAVSVPLPIFNRNQGQIERAEAERRWAEAEWRLVRGEILAELAAARRAVEIATEQVESLRRDFLQRAEDARAVALAAYQEGAADLLVLLEAQRAHTAARELYLQALFEYRRALRELERATGLERLPRGGSVPTSLSEASRPSS